MCCASLPPTCQKLKAALGPFDFAFCTGDVASRAILSQFEPLDHLVQRDLFPEQRSWDREGLDARRAGKPQRNLSESHPAFRLIPSAIHQGTARWASRYNKPDTFAFLNPSARSVPCFRQRGRRTRLQLGRFIGRPTWRNAAIQSGTRGPIVLVALSQKTMTVAWLLGSRSFTSWSAS